MTRKGILKNSTEGYGNGVSQEHEFPSKKKSSSVSFKNITVRGYDRTIGDNPSCTSGCPISIGWRYSNQETFPFEEYENLRPHLRRNKAQMRIPSSARTQLLQNWDYTLSSIIKATREVNKDRHLRQQTTASVFRREMMIQALRGIFLFPMVLCGSSPERAQTESVHDFCNHELSYSVQEPTERSDKFDKSDDSETKSSSSSDLSAEQAYASNGFDDSDDEDDSDDFPDGLSITYHRHIYLE